MSLQAAEQDRAQRNRTAQHESASVVLCGCCCVHGQVLAGVRAACRCQRTGIISLDDQVGLEQLP